MVSCFYISNCTCLFLVYENMADCFILTLSPTTLMHLLISSGGLLGSPPQIFYTSTSSSNKFSFFLPNQYAIYSFFLVLVTFVFPQTTLPSLIRWSNIDYSRKTFSITSTIYPNIIP